MPVVSQIELIKKLSLKKIKKKHLKSSKMQISSFWVKLKFVNLKIIGLSYKECYYGKLGRRRIVLNIDQLWTS